MIIIPIFACSVEEEMFVYNVCMCLCVYIYIYIYIYIYMRNGRGEICHIFFSFYFYLTSMLCSALFDLDNAC